MGMNITFSPLVRLHDEHLQASLPEGRKKDVFARYFN
jgi:hypothetical protein